jgi:hypothetical protein
MAKKNRETLKSHFQNGSLPSQDEFSDLIDSTLNVIDEGFDKSPADGFQVSQLGDDGRLISFFRNVPVDRLLWFLRVDNKDNLIFGNGNTNGNTNNFATLSLAREETQGKGKIGINLDMNQQPEYELDVGGVIKTEGRIGGSLNNQNAVPANREWHDISGELTGCHAFEIMAGVGGERRKGRYALMHAFALNTFNPTGLFFNFLNGKKRIKCHQSYYRSRSDKLRLKWVRISEKEHTYCLKIKSNSDYGKDNDGNDIHIKYYITKLWFDDMSASRYV